MFGGRWSLILAGRGFGAEAAFDCAFNRSRRPIGLLDHLISATANTYFLAYPPG
jgi:hypothetical protein